jgi:type IV secretory pathway VirB3-like protein
MPDPRSSAIPLNDALNKPKNKLGLDYRVALGCIGVGMCVAIFVHLLLGMVLVFAFPAVVRFALRKDRQFYRLWCLSFLQSAHYDPGKVRR